MFKLTRKQLDVLGERQQRIVQGKEKFLNHLRCIHVQKDKIEALRSFMMQPMVQTALGTADMYITLWTNGIHRIDAINYVRNNELDVPIMLTCHFHNNNDKWYYSINREFNINDPELPVLVREFMDDSLGRQSVDISTMLAWRSPSCNRDYHALVPCFEEIKNLLFSSLGHRIVHFSHTQIASRTAHPVGEYIVCSPNKVCDISYEEVQPVIGDDALFNASIFGITGSQFEDIVLSAQYCNTNGGEVYSMNMDDRFWRKCQRTL